MAETIRDLGKKETRKHGLFFSAQYNAEYWFNKGANAALDEIEKLHHELFMGTRNGEITSCWQPIDKLLDKIKELKGEK